MPCFAKNVWAAETRFVSMYQLVHCTNEDDWGPSRSLPVARVKRSIVSKPRPVHRITKAQHQKKIGCLSLARHPYNPTQVVWMRGLNFSSINIFYTRPSCPAFWDDLFVPKTCRRPFPAVFLPSPGSPPYRTTLFNLLCIWSFRAAWTLVCFTMKSYAEHPPDIWWFMQVYAHQSAGYLQIEGRPCNPAAISTPPGG